MTITNGLGNQSSNLDKLLGTKPMRTEADRIAAKIPVDAWRGSLEIDEATACQFISQEEWLVLKADQDATRAATIAPAFVELEFPK